MRDKYANKTPVMRFVHRYTGIIICFALLVFGISYFLYVQSSQYFFEPWSCDMIYHYLFSGSDSSHYPEHDSLTEEQHLRLHEIYDKCQEIQPTPDIFRHG